MGYKVYLPCYKFYSFINLNHINICCAIENDKIKQIVFAEDVEYFTLPTIISKKPVSIDFSPATKTNKFPLKKSAAFYIKKEN